MNASTCAGGVFMEHAQKFETGSSIDRCLSRCGVESGGFEVACLDAIGGVAVDVVHDVGGELVLGGCGRNVPCGKIDTASRISSGVVQ